MTTREIKALMALRGEDVESTGTLIQEAPNRISDTITYARLNKRIRSKLSQHYNIPEQVLFDQPLKVSSVHTAQVAG